MSIPWGIVSGSGDVDKYVRHWKAFSSVGGCDDFVVPIDTTLYRFERVGAETRVTTSPGEAHVKAMRRRRCSDTTVDELDELLGSPARIYVPDRHFERRLEPHPDFVWACDTVSSLSVLVSLQPRSRLAKELIRAAEFAEAYKMMIQFSYG